VSEMFGNSVFGFVIVFVMLSKNIKIKTYRTIILPVILYGCETWLLTLREESRLRVFKNRYSFSKNCFKFPYSKYKPNVN
jgi:hypothetical protein